MGADDKVYRLLNYKNLLNRLKMIGFVKVFSDNLADTLDISPSLVRKDFREFGIRGAQKGGYTIDTVLVKINEVLGIDRKHKVIIVGMGRIGQALIQYPGFRKGGIIISAGFDTDPEKINEDLEIPIFHIKELPAYVKNNNIKLAILAVPENAAMGCLDVMESAGIKGILNFTSMNLKSVTMAINNINIGNEIENLIFTITKK